MRGTSKAYPGVQALENVDAILSVEGLDAVYIGPSDLSLSLGCRPVLDDVDPPAAQAIEHILARAQASSARGRQTRCWNPRR